MITKEMRAAADRLEQFHDRFSPLFGRTEPQQHSRDYLRGLLLHDDNKNVESMTLSIVPESPRRKEVLAMQRFISASPWDHQQVQREIQAVFAQELDPSTSRWLLGTVGAVDESGFEKSGSQSVAVQRQWCGRLGKTENCQVGVYLVGVTPAGSAMLDHELYLPESWADDAEACDKTHVPADVEFRTKPQMALDLLRRTLAAGHVHFDWITADALYGRNHAFLSGLEDLEQRHLVEVPVDTLVWTIDPRLSEADKQRHAVPVGDLVGLAPAEAWKTISLREGTAGPVASRFVACRVWVRRDQEVSPIWLLLRRGLGDGSEVKFYISNASEETALEVLAAVAGSRWWIEHYFQDCKSELGMADYEVRGWAGWHHHMTMVALAHLYVTLTQLQLGDEDVAELSLQMALRLLKSVLPRPELGPEEAQRIVEYHFDYGRIASKSHRESWELRHGGVDIRL